MEKSILEFSSVNYVDSLKLAFPVEFTIQKPARICAIVVIVNELPFSIWNLVLEFAYINRVILLMLFCTNLSNLSLCHHPIKGPYPLAFSRRRTFALL